MNEQTSIPLGCILDCYGNHPAAWLTTDSKADAATNFASYLAIARKAEANHFDFLFVPDSPGMPEGSLDQISRSPRSVNRLEPLTLLAALASVTKEIGLIATVSTSYSEPYTVARQLASLDHISNGRIGWNVVTTENANAWRNYSDSGQQDHGKRYARANEYVEVVQKLWDSWDDDAIVFDRAGGRYFDPNKVRPIDHEGDFFAVKDPLNLARPPQGHPVIVQAGGSEAGRELAAKYADVVFTVQPDLESAQRFTAEIKGRLLKYGRSPASLKVMVGTTMVVGDNEAHADGKLLELGNLVHEDAGRAMIERILEVDLSSVPYDAQIPDGVLPSQSNRNTTYFDALASMIRNEALTLREVSARLSASRIGNVFKGSPEAIVDSIQHWVASGACDGFMLRPTVFPGSLDEFCDKVLPLMRRRGISRSADATGTLRDSLGLLRPVRSSPQENLK